MRVTLGLRATQRYTGPSAFYGTAGLPAVICTSTATNAPAPPLVVGGRMFFQGPKMLSAADVYTGQMLWTAKLPPSQKGHAYVATADRVYVNCDGLLVLDATSGKPIKEGNWPAMERFRVVNGTLIGTDGSEILALDRRTGEVLWRRDAERHAFELAAGPDHVFVMTGLSSEEIERKKRRNEDLPAPGQLLALNLSDGSIAWDKEGIDGGWVAYSQDTDVVVLGSNRSKVRAVQGQDGKPLWERSLSLPVMLISDRLATQNAIHDLHSGEPLTRVDLTGLEQPLTFDRTYGCNTAVGSPCLITFRSGNGGFFDWTNDGGTASLGGFRSGCTNSLIVADGVLCAPKFAAGCSCAYPIYTALALAHVPEADAWTTNNFPAGTGRLDRVGINFGAPGDRRSPEGTLWLDYPSVGGASPNVEVAIAPEGAVDWYCRHSSRYEGSELNWVGSSGARAIRSLTIRTDYSTAKDTLEVHVAEGNDDGEEYANGEMYLTSSDLELIREEDKDQTVGIRFQRVMLERGEKIRAAHLQFTVDEVSDMPTELTIRAEASNNASVFGIRPFDITNRKKTKAFVKWTPAPWNVVGESGEAQRTPDLSPLIAEVISRRGWRAGSAIALIIEGSGQRVADSFNGGHTPTGEMTSPLLVVRRDVDRAAETTKSSAAPTCTYTVRLVFAEPDDVEPGERVFDVAIQGETVLSEFDIAAEAAGPHRVLVKEFPGIAAADTLRIELTPQRGEPILCGVELRRDAVDHLAETAQKKPGS